MTAESTETKRKKKSASLALGASESSRIRVSKTYKMYVGGAFIRSEQGRYLQQYDREGKFVANYVWASRKDFRDAMQAARKAQGGWATRSAFNRGQIMFRMAEMLEDRRSIFVEKLVTLLGYAEADAHREVDISVDRLFWYAGWCDKYAQVLGSINPVAAPFFNFSFPEPTGVVTVFAPTQAPLLGLVTSFAPVILSGNTCVVIIESQAPLISGDFGEVLATSDLPGGVVNLLTGYRKELLPHVAQHMDLNAVAYYGDNVEHIKAMQQAAAGNVKRVEIYGELSREELQEPGMQSLYRVLPFLEMKTAWHPMGL